MSKHDKRVEPEEGYQPGQIVVIHIGSPYHPYKIIFIKDRFKKAKNKKKAKWWYNYIIVDLFDSSSHRESQVEYTECTDTWKLMEHNAAWYCYANEHEEQSEDNLLFIIKFKHPSAYIREYLGEKIEHYQDALMALDSASPAKPQEKK